MKIPIEIQQGNTITVKSDQYGIITGKVNTYGSKDFIYLTRWGKCSSGFSVTNSSLLKLNEYGKTWKLKNEGILSYMWDKLEELIRFMKPKGNGF